MVKHTKLRIDDETPVVPNTAPETEAPPPAVEAPAPPEVRFVAKGGDLFELWEGTKLLTFGPRSTVENALLNWRPTAA